MKSSHPRSPSTGARQRLWAVVCTSVIAISCPVPLGSTSTLVERYLRAGRHRSAAGATSRILKEIGTWHKTIKGDRPRFRGPRSTAEFPQLTSPASPDTCCLHAPGLSPDRRLSTLERFLCGPGATSIAARSGGRRYCASCATRCSARHMHGAARPELLYYRCSANGRSARSPRAARARRPREVRSTGYRVRLLRNARAGLRRARPGPHRRVHPQPQRLGRCPDRFHCGSYKAANLVRVRSSGLPPRRTTEHSLLPRRGSGSRHERNRDAISGKATCVEAEVGTWKLAVRHLI